MEKALALLPVILAAIPTITTGVNYLISWVESVRQALKQSGEWTPEMETAFLNSLVATKTDPAYQPDPKP